MRSRSAISVECPGEHCDCKDCTIRLIGNRGAVYNEWLRRHQSPKQVSHKFRIMSAKLAMLDNGIYVPKRFYPTLYARGNEEHTPQQLFPETHCKFTMFPGFTPYRFSLYRSRPVGPRTPIKMQLIYTDGACSNNGHADARAGVGFSFCLPGRVNTRGCVSLPLEQEGPDGELYDPTSNRAELRAVIAALEYRKWYLEGWEAVVIATDSAYVVNGATKWVSEWVENGWCKSNGRKAAHKDLWVLLLSDFRHFAIHGCEIMFWHIPREQNTLAHDAATRALDSKPRIKWKTAKDSMLKTDDVFDI